MIALALLCLLLAAAAVVFMVAVGTTQLVSFSFFAGDFVTNPIWIFVAGAVAMLLTLAALAFLRRGTARKSAQRHEIKRLRKIEETAVPANAAPAAAAPATAAPMVADTRHDTTGSAHRHAQGDTHEGHAHDDANPRKSGADETLIREPRPVGDEGTRRV